MSEMRRLEREQLVHSFRYGESGCEIAHLLAQHPSRVVINHLTRLGGILFETRYRAGYKGIIIPCHRFFSIHLNSEAKVPDFAYRLARVIALARRTWESCGRCLAPHSEP